MRFKDNAIQLEDGDLERFKKDGWKIDVHASNESGPYYFNFIGINFMGLDIGFSSWKDDLGLWIEGNNKIEIKSQRELVSVLNDLRKMHSEISPIIKNSDISEMICTGQYCY